MSLGLGLTWTLNVCRRMALSDPLREVLHHTISSPTLRILVGSMLGGHPHCNRDYTGQEGSCSLDSYYIPILPLLQGGGGVLLRSMVEP